MSESAAMSDSVAMSADLGDSSNMDMGDLADMGDGESSESGEETDGMETTDPSEPEPFFFLFGADPQLGFIDDDDFELDAALLQLTIDNANVLRPRFVVLAGDLINQTMNEGQTEAFWDVASTLDPAIPLYLIAGNHDLGNTPTPTTLSWYRHEFADDSYAFEVEGSLFIVANAPLLKAPTAAPDEAAAHRSWFVDTLAGAGERPHIFVLQHQPWIISAADEPETYFNMPQALRDEFFPHLDAAGVDAVFTGHLHRNAYAEVGDVEHIATSAVGVPLGADPAGLRIIRVYADHFEHTFYAHAEVPTYIEL